jgi:FtsH-binding integral membrane protein
MDGPAIQRLSSQVLSLVVCALGLLSLVTATSDHNRLILQVFFVLAAILSAGLAYLEFSRPQTRISPRSIWLHPYTHNIAVFITFAFFPIYSIGVLIEAAAYHFAVFCFVSDLHLQTKKDFSQASLTITQTLATLDPLIVLEVIARIAYYRTRPYFVAGLVYILVGTMFRAMISERHRSAWQSISIPIGNGVAQSQPGIVQTVLGYLQAFADFVYGVGRLLWPVDHQTTW